MDINHLLETTYKEEWAKNKKIEIHYKGVEAFVTTSQNRETSVDTLVNFPLNFITDFFTPMLPSFTYQDN
jgi:hypothetical protein